MKSALRIVLVGTGTEVGKTHVASALLFQWAQRVRVVGLKPVETGVALEGGRRRGAELSDQERLARAARLFHVKLVGGRKEQTRGRSQGRAPTNEERRRSALREPARTNGASKFHVKRRATPFDPPSRSAVRGRQPHPERALFTFPEPVSPHLAARAAGIRIDIGMIARWVDDHQAPVTIVETAGGLFSPLGHGTTNFDLTQALRPDAVLLVASDRLGVLHELTTTLALNAARGGAPLGVILSAPDRTDLSTGRNHDEIIALGIARPIGSFPRAPENHPATTAAAQLVIAWVEQLTAGRG